MSMLPTGGSSQTLKLRIQNMCCGKEANLIKSTLAEVNGITSVTVNVVGRTAFISYDVSAITSCDIIEKLNALHLGISLVESGELAKSKYGKKELILHLKYINVFVMACLFTAVVVGRVKHYSFEEWTAIVVIILGGLPMVWKMLVDFKRRVLININCLMLIAVGGAVALHDWLAGSIIVFIFAIAELIENQVRYKVEKDIAALMMTAPEMAVLADTGQSLPVEEVPEGTLILVTAGDRIPLDGQVTEGRASVDESSMTGESTPINKRTDSSVYSGSIVQSGFLKIKTTCDYQSSTVFRVSQLVAEAQSKSSRTEEIVNKFAKIYTPFILFVSFAFFIIPFIIYKTTSKMTESEYRQWGVRSLTILLVSCPCAIIMAAPITFVCGITNAAKMCVLIKGGVYLEKLSKLNVVVFDKTGTLTEGRFQVLKEHAMEPSFRDEAMKLAASLEAKSSHPLAASIISHYSGCITEKINELGIAVGLPSVTQFKNHDGMGLSGNASDHFVCIGNIELMNTFNVEVDGEIRKQIEEWSVQGCTVALVAIDGKLEMMLGLADKCRVTAKPAVQGLQSLGLQCIMLTGDREGTAQVIKQQVELDYCVSGMKPNEKYEWILEEQHEGKSRKFVAMVGDGVNDSPSLAAADVGISMGSSGAALAVESSGISLMTDDLTKICDLISLGKFCKRIVWQNIFGCTIIKLIFVICGQAGKDFLWLAALSDVVGLLFVMWNGVRPLNWKSKMKYDDIGVNNESNTVFDERDQLISPQEKHYDIDR